MKQLFICSFLLMLALSDRSIAQQSNADSFDCSSSPRVVGAFGAMDNPVPPVVVSDALRDQLAGLKTVRASRSTLLAPTGEQVVMYDTGADELAPNPRIAVIADGTVVATFELAKLMPYAGQAIYQASCQFELQAGQSGFVAAYTLSGDGTGSAFVVLAHTGNKYQVVFSDEVGQGRLVFQPGTFELWERTFDKRRSNPDLVNFECEWCDHRYLITKYAWRNDRYVKTRSTRTKTTFDPAVITGTPVIVRTVEPARK